MVEYYPLDKIYKVGKDYSSSDDEYLLINRIGTNSSEAADIEIDGVDTGKIIEEVAPLKKSNGNMLGTLYLGDLIYVIPPRKRFRIIGAANKVMRIKGKIGKLGVGETIPTDDLARFEPRGKHYIMNILGEHSLSNGERWNSKSEYEIYTVTPKTIETYIFNNYVGVYIEGGSVAESDFGVRFYVEGVPQDVLTRPIGMLGIDSLSMPKPPTNTNMVEFTLEETPITVTGDRTIRITVINESGAYKDPSDSNTAWKVSLAGLVEYQKK